MTNARLPKVLEGSLKNPSLTLSHHRDISPIACSLSALAPQPLLPKNIKSNAVVKTPSKAK